MKKVLVAVALVLGLGSSVAFAQEVSNTPAVETQTQAPQDEYTKIEVKDLPEAVTQAITKSYEDATIKEAYVAEKETGKVYKVIITTKDAQEVTVLLNEKGEEYVRTGTGLLAKAFCHEIDHLHGILYSDKVVQWENG